MKSQLEEIKAQLKAQQEDGRRTKAQLEAQQVDGRRTKAQQAQLEEAKAKLAESEKPHKQRIRVRKKAKLLWSCTYFILSTTCNP